MAIQKTRSNIFVVLAVASTFALCASPVAAAVMGFLQTPASSGVASGGGWVPPASGTGYRITWDITQNPDNTWHYVYVFTREDGGTLMPMTSHVIFQLSETAGEEDLFNFTGDLEKVEFGTFGPSSGNPGFPPDEVTFGVKINLAFNQRQIEFDSTRAPMWGDFYSKGGSNTFAYNVDLGTDVANLHDIHGTPVDAEGIPLAKILVPNTLIPEPATIGLMLICAIGAARRARRRN